MSWITCFLLQSCKKIMFYTEIFTRKVDFAYFFTRFAHENRRQIYFSHQNCSVKNSFERCCWFFFNEISNENYSSRIFFPWKVEHLIPLELPSVNDGAFAIFFLYLAVFVSGIVFRFISLHCNNYFLHWYFDQKSWYCHLFSGVKRVK